MSAGSDGTGGPLVLPGNPERALRYEFSCKVGGKPEFRYCQGEWTKHVESVVIDDLPFAEGALRACYRMQLVQKDGSRKNVVAKVSKDPNEDKNTYYGDVHAQACAKMWAMEYNDSGVPKIVDFVPAYVFELVDRPGRPLIGAEEFIEGVFQKHNNNVGGTTGGVQEERATPNAFSHFTWEASNHSILVCDIQGVGDTYTDPQIHTINGKGFGRGNLGQAGLNAFLARHKCNSICESLGLPLLGIKGDTPLEDRGGTPSRGKGGAGLGGGWSGGGGSMDSLDMGLRICVSLTGTAIKIKPFDSSGQQAPVTTRTRATPNKEETLALDSDIPLLSAAPSSRSMLKKDEGKLAKLDKTDEGLMDDILNELEHL